MLSSFSAKPLSLHLGFRQTLWRLSSAPPAVSSPVFRSQARRLEIGGRRLSLRRSHLPFAAIDESFGRIGDVEEESRDDIVHLGDDVDLPKSKSNRNIGGKNSLKQQQQGCTKKRMGYASISRIAPGVMINTALIIVLVTFLLLLDWFSWRITRRPLGPFFLTHPFLIAAVLSAFAGWLYVPTVDSMNVHQILRQEGPTTHYNKKGTPTMGGLFFIPVGIAVSMAFAGQNSLPLHGAVVATLAFAAIGLIDDLLSCMKGHNNGLSGWTKLFLQVAVGIWFSFWLVSTNITTPYNMKLLVPLPAPIGLVNFGKLYLVLTAFCFAAMGNGVNLTDGLDGLAGGVSALAFIGMSVTVLAICPDLAIFGASMAGACVGFLCHNRYKASVFMGDTGSLALGGALAAMACCTGMFFPLFISSGVFVMEVLSVIVQVSHVKVTKYVYGKGKRFFRMSPLHHHFELCGLKEPIIVASAYFISCLFALFAGYIGLISA